MASSGGWEVQDQCTRIWSKEHLLTLNTHSRKQKSKRENKVCVSTWQKSRRDRTYSYGVSLLLPRLECSGTISAQIYTLYKHCKPRL
nr:putative protein ATXN8OS [Macaca fascicularis]